MSFGCESPSTREDVATLARHLRVRVLNCSAAGCLLETTAPVPVGASGNLRVSFEGRDFNDTIQIVRCEHIKGTDSVHHVGTKFISTSPPYVGSLRYTMRHGVTELAAWLDTEKDQDR
jgi:hypothetical protein